MATFGEMVYMVLDLLKEHSDDAYYTEEHVLFLASKMRAYLIEKKYRETRNSTFTEMSDENKQQICISLEAATMLPEGCGGSWLKSTEKIPDTLGDSLPILSAPSDMLHSMITYIPAERMPYVGYNKWLKNIIYAAISGDGYLYLHGSNPQFMLLESAKMEAVFSDPEEAAKLSCDADEAGGCDIMSMTFPLEQALIPGCIEMVAQELLGSRYAPEDKQNNASDDLGKIGVTQQRASRPASGSRKQSEGD